MCSWRLPAAGQRAGAGVAALRNADHVARRLRPPGLVRQGTQETYWDRQDARVGIYHGRVKDQYFDYIKPQETGNKEAVRWLALADAQGAVCWRWAGRS